MLYLLGAIAVVVAVYRRQATSGDRLSTVAAAAAILANVWYPVMYVVSIGRPIRATSSGCTSSLPPWRGGLRTRCSGFVALRIGVVTRWGALALGVGSLLAILGMSQLGLTTEANPTIFAPIAMIGVALNGLGWILLGLDVMLDGQAVPRLRSALAR